MPEKNWWEESPQEFADGFSEEVQVHHSDLIESLPPFTSEKPCPRCKELLHWSESEHPPTVSFNTRTGKVWSVSLMRFCIRCGYKEVGTLNNINQDPIWVAQKEED